MTVLEPERQARRVALELLLVFQEPGRAVRRASGALGGAQHALDRDRKARRRRPRSTRRSAMFSAAGSIRRSSARASISRSASGRDARRKPARRSTVPTANGPPRSRRCSNDSAIAPEDALVRARVLYYMQIGYYALDIREPMEARLEVDAALSRNIHRRPAARRGPRRVPRLSRWSTPAPKISR